MDSRRSPREYPKWMYCYGDARTDEIVRLTAELQDRDDMIASLTALIEYHFGLIVQTTRTGPHQPPSGARSAGACT
jgi:hypothetical protein